MAQSPVPSYKVTDRRGTDRDYPIPGASNFLYKAARQTDQRNWVYDNNKDIHRNISSKGRQTLATLGTDLYANHPVIKGAINEMAYYSLGVWIPEYYGRNPAWGDLAEAWMLEHDKICNVDGSTMLDYLLNLVRGVLVQGDIATVYTETINGYPKLQQIPGHRIKSGDDEGKTIASNDQFDGATLIDGVLVDQYGAPAGYRVWTDKEYEHIPASGMMLHFIREYPGQLRGLSQLATVFTRSRIGREPGSRTRRTEDRQPPAG
jgi:capsid protein